MFVSLNISFTIQTVFTDLNYILHPDVSFLLLLVPEIILQAAVTKIDSSNKNNSSNSSNSNSSSNVTGDGSTSRFFHVEATKRIYFGCFNWNMYFYWHLFFFFFSFFLPFLRLFLNFFFFFYLFLYIFVFFSFSSFSLLFLALSFSFFYTTIQITTIALKILVVWMTKWRNKHLHVLVRKK